MLIVDMIAAFLAAALSGLGVGSGGLLVIYLTLVAGMEQRLAQGVNLLFFLFSGGAALAVHAAHRKLYPGVILLLTVFGIGGSFLGVALSHMLPPLLLRQLFGGMLVFSGILTFKRIRKGKKVASRSPKRPFR